MRNRSGFTVVEVILFLAITSLLIIVGVTSLSGRSSSVQFTDATRSLAAFFERRIDQIQDGSFASELQDCRWNASTRTYVAGASDGSCIFLGYMFNIDSAQPTQVEVYQMFGGRLPTNAACFNTGEPLTCVYPRAAPVTSTTPVAVETYDIPWGIEVSQIIENQPPNPPIGLFGYLRNPVGQNLFPVSFAAGQEGRINDVAAYASSFSDSKVGSDFSAVMCLTNGQRASSVSLGADDDLSSVRTDFDEGLSAALCSP